MKRRVLILALTLASAFTLAGCASTGMEGTRQFNENFARDAYGVSVSSDSSAARGNADALLGQPLSGDDAVRLALTLSPQFQAMLAEQAAQSAAAAQMGRLPNPVFKFERLVKKHDGEVELDIGRMLSISLLEFIYLPSRMRTSDALQQQVRLASAAQVVEAATNARQAWVRAVAAEQALVYFQQVMDAAEASAELAKRMYQAGNFSKLQRARQQAFYAEATAQLARAKQTAVSTREALIRTLGLNSTQAAQLKLPARLPDLPTSAKPESVIAQKALDQRLDVRLAVAELEALAARQGFTRTQSVMNALHLTGIRISETGEPVKKGYELEIGIPIFDLGDATRSQAAQQVKAAQFRVAQTGLAAESALREQYAAWRTAYDYALHYRDEVVPLKKLIADEMLLQYNGMLIGVFDLLTGTRDQIGSIIAAIDAQRDFWLADAALDATLLGKPVMAPLPSAAAVAAGGDAGGH
ncbi:MAG: TolC family protein [Burkholderiales bacterium]|nr:TolC family protein [Burkholderiales bacterium]